MARITATRIEAAACFLVVSGALCPAQVLQYEHLFTLGSKTGVNPTVRFNSRHSRLAFGKPARLSPLVTPDSVAVSGEERVWITDRGSASVHMFDLLENRYKEVRAAGKTAFVCPSGIDADIHGNVYVADACLGQVFVLDQEGAYLRTLLGRRKDNALAAPGAVAVSRDLKRVYVADPPHHRVVIVNQEGETVGQLQGLGFPQALAFGSRRIFVLDALRQAIEIFSPDGARAGSLAWNQVRAPSAFAFDAERKLYLVGDRYFEMVMAFSETGALVGAFGQSGSGAGEMHVPGALYVDASHRVFVVDPGNAKVLAFAESSEARPALRP